MNWLAVDPGVSGTGWALFKGVKLVDWGIITSKETTWERRVRDIVSRMRGNIWAQGDRVFCEWPTGRFTSAAGLAAANSDAMLKLTFLIGALDNQLNGIELIPVQRWKGQLPKEVVQKRAEKFFGVTGFKSHAADAVGIGQFVIEENLLTLA